MDLRLALIAFLFHAPGLWLFRRRRLTGRLVTHNVIAVALTLVAMAAAAWCSGLAALGAAWAIGHALWGAWLFRAAVRRDPGLAPPAGAAAKTPEN